MAADLELTLDPDAGPSIQVTGAAGGSNYTLSAVGTGLMPQGDGPRTISITAENPEAYHLLEQLGFALLPLEGEGKLHFLSRHQAARMTAIWP